MILDCVDLCWACRVHPAVWGDWASKASQAVFQALPEDPVAAVLVEVERGLAGPAVVEAAVEVGSAADVVAVDSAGQGAATVPEATATASSSAIAEIAGVRAFMATCPSNGRALPPMPSSSR